MRVTSKVASGVIGEINRERVEGGRTGSPHVSDLRTQSDLKIQGLEWFNFHVI